jgi:FkbM family methyltransferase
MLTASRRVIGFPREIQVKQRDLAYALHLRLRTSDISLYDELIVRKEYDIGCPEFHPKIIVDAGANVGLASVYFANKYPEATIIAVEPEPSNFKMLIRNSESYRKIFPVNAALWKADGIVNLGLDVSQPTDRAKWAFRVVSNGTVPIRAVTMRTLMSECGLETIDLLKVDIEGAEREVFADSDWMDMIGVILVELHDRLQPGCRDAVRKAAKGFASWEKGEMTVLVHPKQQFLPDPYTFKKNESAA